MFKLAHILGEIKTSPVDNDKLLIKDSEDNDTYKQILLSSLFHVVTVDDRVAMGALQAKEGTIAKVISDNSTNIYDGAAWILMSGGGGGTINKFTNVENAAALTALSDNVICDIAYRLDTKDTYIYTSSGWVTLIRKTVFNCDDIAERDALSSREGDIAIVGLEVYIWDSVKWIDVSGGSSSVTIVETPVALAALNPNSGDVAKVTSNSKTYIFDGNMWVMISGISVHVVDSIADMGNIIGINGDIAKVLNTSEVYAYDGEWILIASDIGADGIITLSTDSVSAKLVLQNQGQSYYSIGLDRADKGKMKIGTGDVGSSTSVTVDLNGEVGVGTTEPEELVHVNGDDDTSALISSKNEDAALKLSNTGQTDVSIGLDRSDGGKLKIGFGEVGNAPILTMDINGRLGIGTDAPEYLLDLIPEAGNAIARVKSNDQDALILLETGDQPEWYFGIDKSDSGKLKCGTAAVVGLYGAFTIDPITKRIGFKQDNPEAAVHIGGAAQKQDFSELGLIVSQPRSPNTEYTDIQGPIISLRTEDTDTDTKWTCGEIVGLAGIAGQPASGSKMPGGIAFKVKGLTVVDDTEHVTHEAMRIDYMGNLGIGTTNPKAHLHVSSPFAAETKMKVSTSPSGTHAGLSIDAESVDWDVKASRIDKTISIIGHEAGEFEVIHLDINGETNEFRLPQIYGQQSAGSSNLNLASDGLLTRNTSSKYIKKDIDYEGVDPDLALSLKPVSYTGKSDDKQYLGFIAEDVLESDKRLGQEAEGYLPGLDQNAIIASLTALVQKQQKQIDELTEKVDKLSE